MCNAFDPLQSLVGLATAGQDAHVGGEVDRIAVLAVCGFVARTSTALSDSRTLAARKGTI